LKERERRLAWSRISKHLTIVITVKIETSEEA